MDDDRVFQHSIIARPEVTRGQDTLRFDEHLPEVIRITGLDIEWPDKTIEHAANGYIVQFFVRESVYAKLPANTLLFLKDIDRNVKEIMQLSGCEDDQNCERALRHYIFQNGALLKAKEAYLPDNGDPILARNNFQFLKHAHTCHDHARDTAGIRDRTAQVLQQIQTGSTLIFKDGNLVLERKPKIPKSRQKRLRKLAKMAQEPVSDQKDKPVKNPQPSEPVILIATETNKPTYEQKCEDLARIVEELQTNIAEAKEYLSMAQEDVEEVLETGGWKDSLQNLFASGNIQSWGEVTEKTPAQDIGLARLHHLLGDLLQEEKPDNAQLPPIESDFVEAVASEAPIRQEKELEQLQEQKKALLKERGSLKTAIKALELDLAWVQKDLPILYGHLERALSAPPSQDQPAP